MSWLAWIKTCEVQHHSLRRWQLRLALWSFSFGFEVWVGVPPTESLCSEHPWPHGRWNTSPRSFLVRVETFLGKQVSSQPVSLKVAGRRRVDPALSDLVFQFVYRATDSRRCLPHTKQVLFSIENIAESHATFQRSEGKTVDLQTLTGGMCKNTQFLCEKKPCPIPPMTANSEIWLAGKHVSSWN